MALKDRLRKLAGMAAVGSTMFAPAAFAEQPVPPPAPITQSVNRQTQSWDATRFSAKQMQRLQATYDSLPDKYKAFVGKDFDTRFAMKEELEQRVWQSLQKDDNPEDYVGMYETETHRDGLSVEQKNMVDDLIHLGRPAETLDTSKPLPEQLRSCGFNEIARVYEGENYNDFSFKEQGRFVHEMSWAGQALEANPTQKVELKRKLQAMKPIETGKTRTLEEDNQMPKNEFVNVNGSQILKNPEGLSAAGSYSREVILNTAEKLKQSDTSKAVSQAVVNKAFDRN